jgi:hypothetical protein
VPPAARAAGGTSVGDLPASSVSAVQLILQELGSAPTPPYGRQPPWSHILYGTLLVLFMLVEVQSSLLAEILHVGIEILVYGFIRHCVTEPWRDNTIACTCTCTSTCACTCACACDMCICICACACACACALPTQRCRLPRPHCRAGRAAGRVRSHRVAHCGEPLTPQLLERSFRQYGVILGLGLGRGRRRRRRDCRCRWWWQRWRRRWSQPGRLHGVRDHVSKDACVFRPCKRNAMRYAMRCNA